MRIGYAQLNTTVGDLEGNLALGMDAYEQLCGQGVDLIISLNFSSVATHQEIYYIKKTSY